MRTILPVEIAAYILNEKRQAIIDIEKRQSVSVIVVPSSHLLTPQYEIERVRQSDISEKDEKLASYKLAIKQEVTALATAANPKAQREPSTIKSVGSVNIEELSVAPPITAAAQAKNIPKKR